MNGWSQFRKASRAVVVVVAVASTFAASGIAVAQDKVVFQATDGDVAKWNLILNNVRNLQAAASPDADIEVVAYGPAVTLLKSDSPLAARIKETVANKVEVVACKNTMAGQKLTEADMLTDIGYVPAGVVEVMKKQQQGYVYIRP